MAGRAGVRAEVEKGMKPRRSRQAPVMWPGGTAQKRGDSILTVREANEGLSATS